MKRLGTTIAKSGNISIWACETGKGDEGKKFLELMNEKLGCTVGGNSKNIWYNALNKDPTVLNDLGGALDAARQQIMNSVKAGQQDRFKKLR